MAQAAVLASPASFALPTESAPLSPEQNLARVAPGVLVGWWLLQGLALGAAGGAAVSAAVIGGVLALKTAIGG